MKKTDATPRIKLRATRSLSLSELKAEKQHRPSVAQTLLSTIRRQTRVSAPPKITHGKEQINALWGNNLTWYVDEEGQGVGIGGPPLHAAHMVKHAREPRFIGRSLTRHVDPKGKIHAELHRYRQLDQTPWIKRVAINLLTALKWLFGIKFRVQVLERYIWGEAFGSFLVGSMAVTFFLVGTTIFSYGEKIFTKHIPPFTIAKVMLLGAPQFLVLAIPIAVLFSTLMAMGRFNRDNEIIAMTTSGVSLYRIFLPFIAVAIFSGLLTWSVYENVVPPYSKENKDTLKAFWNAQVVDFIKEKIVIKAPNKKYFYVDRINKQEQTMHDIRLWDYYGDNGQMRNFPRMFKAEEGHVADGFLVLSNVSFYEIDKERGNTLVEARMPEVRIDIATQLSEYSIREDAMELKAMQLRARISRERDKIKAMQYLDPGIINNLNKDLVGYYFKYSIPLACLAFVLVAVPVSLRGPRDERNMGIIMSFVLVMIYYIIFFTCREVGSRGLIVPQDLKFAGVLLAKGGTNLFPPYIAGWLPPVLFFLASIPLIARARR
jgi:lipopolysaccharide export system permease protein